MKRTDSNNCALVFYVFFAFIVVFFFWAPALYIEESLGIMILYIIQETW